MKSSRWSALLSLCLLFPALLHAQEVTLDATKKDPLVNILNLDSTFVLDIRYATTNNFTGIKLYPFAACFLHEKVAERLDVVQRKLQSMGYGLKLFDCYRPMSVQWKMWDKVHDTRYVANPAKGSNHNRGCAVDVGLVDIHGHDLPQPTDFDDFTEKAHLDYVDIPGPALKNRQILYNAMYNAGFVPLNSEWWHFSDPGCEQYGLIDLPFKDLVLPN